MNENKKALEEKTQVCAFLNYRITIVFFVFFNVYITSQIMTEHNSNDPNCS